MDITKIGGEFGLIKRLTKKPINKQVIKGIGDDAAVIKFGDNYLLFTADTQVEGDHFSLDYFTPRQIGKKAVEINVSDIGAMGGVPKFFLVSLVIPKTMDVEIIEDIYNGMREVCNKYYIEIVGGNITHGTQLIIDISMIGKAAKQNLKFRSDAKPGDVIMVSGNLGSSTAGLNLFLKNIDDFDEVKRKHTEPEAKFYKVKPFLKYINAMIDISDGLASEVTRICEQSKTGAIIYADSIPIKPITQKAAQACNKNALDFALYGGEDFELVYTVSEENLDKVKGIVVGKITGKKRVRILKDGKEEIVSGHGYDHFLTNSKVI
ncbi:MAG: thiamine-phosphate kinase [Actinobacteria bacterium]|nr:thiamine-phosphate kinase [Actinomycetota bacterium]